jgi:hypothetical protein
VRRSPCPRREPRWLDARHPHSQHETGRRIP